MSVEGKWVLSMKTPIGQAQTILELHEDGQGGLTGQQTGEGRTSQIMGGRFDGTQIFWINLVTAPMSLKLEFSGVVDGDQMSGSVKAGIMGKFSFQGQREA